MKLNFFFFTLSFVFVAAIANGQTDSTYTGDSTQAVIADSTPMPNVDSTQMLKNQERAGKISGQLARNREKLAHLEKDLEKMTATKQKASAQAEASANENRNAAVELSDDAANRKKARRAEKSASRARRDTKSVQRAEKNLQRLEKDISKVKKQIEENEKALAEVQKQ